MNDALQWATREAFPDRSVVSMEEQTVRPGNEVGLVSFEDADPVFLKTATDDTRRRLAREVAATRYAAEHCPVGVPEVVAADPDGDPPYLATERLPGTPLNDPWTGDGDWERLVREAGFALAGVHEATVDRAGTIAGGDADGLEYGVTGWADALCATVEWRAEDWFPDRFADLPPRLVETIREVEPALEPVTPTLCHADASRINVHLDPHGLLDWERALVGDPAFDLVDTEGHLIDQGDVEEEDREGLTRALYDGYRERAGSLPDGLDSRRPLYRAVAHLLVPQAFDKWKSQVDVPDDELEATVREEFEDRIEAAREMV